MLCYEITDEAIEIYARGRVAGANPELVKHLEMCPKCKVRLDECREWNRQLRKAANCDAACSQ